MSDPSTSAMDNHLQRYETSDAGNESDSHTTGGGGDADETSFWGLVFAEASHPLPNDVRARLSKGVRFYICCTWYAGRFLGVMA